MLKDYFSDGKTIEKLKSGPAGPHLDAFSIWLENDGYKRRTIRRHIHGVGVFSVWAQNNKIFVNDFNTKSLDSFSSYLSSYGCLRCKNRKYSSIFIGARHFIRFLNISGITKDTIPVPSQKPPLLNAFFQWMLNQRGVKESTLNNYCPVIENLLKTLGAKSGNFDAKKLRKFVIDHSKRSGIGKAKIIVTSVRMFLRFLISIGKCDPGLEFIIPTIAGWRLSSLPDFIPSEDIELIIDACDPSIPLESRDKAIILLLSRLGLRAGDVAGLKIKDIDWTKGTILVSGKSRIESLLPLPQDVGDAILHYLEYTRPKVNTNKIFITIKAPFVPISRKVITKTAARSIRRAGIEAPSYNAHIFRHSAATIMLQEGLSLHDIGKFLRHRSVETTAHYTKVDANLLKIVTMPWPKGGKLC